MRFRMAVPQTWQADWTALVEQSRQQLCPHWNTTERSLRSHSGQFTVSATGLLLAAALPPPPPPLLFDTVAPAVAGLL